MNDAALAPAMLRVLEAAPRRARDESRVWIEEQSHSASLAVIGTYPPRKCGIATFTFDLVEQLAIHEPGIRSQIYALATSERLSDYPADVSLIEQGRRESHLEAARAINLAAPDAVWLQHEFGIFGGDDGEWVCDFVDAIAAPLIVTFHSVLKEPSTSQRRIMEHLISRAARIMVMARRGCELLINVYRAPADRIAVIAHGAPDRPFGRSAEKKQALGLGDRRIMMTFGLLGPGKGLEHAIAALPDIVERHPDVLYRIVGATHPNLVARDGESYRRQLIDLADRLGVSNHIAWDDRFLETDELLDQLEACDIYLTPYPNLQQATSGTLSYAVALGKPVVSTPYVHAAELLADGVGVLVEPMQSAAIAAAVNGLFDDPDRLAATARRAYAAGRKTIWPEFARASAELIEQAIARVPDNIPLTVGLGMSGFLAMCDATGMLQHAIGVVPDRRHGYCLDDNARALILMNHAAGAAPHDRVAWSITFASFIQYAWNPDRASFRNFMRFDRTWSEEAGSDDSNGRALWALGDTVAHARDTDLRSWAAGLYDEAAPCIDRSQSPRAIAFGMLGAAAMLRRCKEHRQALALLERGGTLLSNLLDRARQPDWTWFETVLAYDNPRLPQALIEAGSVLDNLVWVGLGLDTLAWIAERQTSTKGLFRPVGSDSFGGEFRQMPFDQQPLEAQAAIEACLAAYAIDSDERWYEHAVAAWSWFFGANDRGMILGDIATGRCRDGVTPRGVNANCGAESILAFQLSNAALQKLLALRRAVRSTGDEILAHSNGTSPAIAHSR